MSPNKGIKQDFAHGCVVGGLAQMVERSLSMREVPGSMPGSSRALISKKDLFCIANTVTCSLHVRMAERSKAPDSREQSLPLTLKEHSGPRMWAWVRIPLLTTFSNNFF